MNELSNSIKISAVIVSCFLTSALQAIGQPRDDSPPGSTTVSIMHHLSETPNTPAEVSVPSQEGASFVSLKKYLRNEEDKYSSLIFERAMFSIPVDLHQGLVIRVYSVLDSVDTLLSALREGALLAVLSEAYTAFNPHYTIEGQTEEDRTLNRRRIYSEFIQHFNLKKWKEAIVSVQTSNPSPSTFKNTRAIVKAYRK